MQTNPAVEQNKTLNGLWVRGISPIGKEKVYANAIFLVPWHIQLRKHGMETQRKHAYVSGAW